MTKTLQQFPEEKSREKGVPVKKVFTRSSLQETDYSSSLGLLSSLLSCSIPHLIFPFLLFSHISHFILSVSAPLLSSSLLFCSPLFSPVLVFSFVSTRLVSSHLVLSHLISSHLISSHFLSLSSPISPSWRLAASPGSSDESKASESEDLPACPSDFVARVCQLLSLLLLTAVKLAMLESCVLPAQ